MASRPPCLIDECESVQLARGYCNKHYKRLLRNGDPLVARRIRGLIRDPEGRKRCVGCQEWLPLTSFGANKNNSDGLGSNCRPCNVAYQRMRKFGLTNQAWLALLAKQGGRCAICGTADPGPKTWHVDHDHSCCPTPHRTSATTCGKCVRGLLCHLCNTALGGFRDDPAVLRAAIDYLRRTSTVQPRIMRGAR